MPTPVPPPPPPPDADFIALQRALAGQYSIERELGRGGMGIVYLAREVALDRPVAIKLLPPALGLRPELRERFVREARTAARLSHPHIVPIHRVGEDAGLVWFVMAYVEGETLAQRIRTRGPLAPRDAVRMLREVAWALAYAHARGIVHRDVKPDNILLEHGSGRALVTDFGIAWHADAGPNTGDGLVMGTAQYMSPEQASGEAIDGRSDLYALGVVAHVALTGRLPFEAGTVPRLLAQHLSVPAPSLASRARGVPNELAVAIDRCLAKDPAARWPNGEALAEALEQSTAAAREMPLPLRLWLTKRDPLMPLYAVWSSLGVGGGFFAILSAMRFGAPPSAISAALTMMALGAGVPLVAAAKIRLWETHKALAAGLTLDDLRRGLREHLRVQREQLAFDVDREPSLMGKLLRAISYGGLATFVGATAYLGLFPATADRALLSYFFGFGAMAAIGAGAMGLAIPGRRLSAKRFGILRERFWHSRLGEWAARIAGIGTRRGTAPAALGSRPTELAIGIAADQLLAALPRETRERLGDLPRALRGLEERASHERARVDQLDARIQELQLGEDPAARSHALAQSGPGAAVVAQAREELLDSLRVERERAAERLGSAVAALENVRLDLLRLQLGDATGESITAILEVTERLSHDVDLALDARAEVDRSLARTPTPA